jgi:hypothetical protein
MDMFALHFENTVESPRRREPEVPMRAFVRAAFAAALVLLLSVPAIAAE